MWDEQFNYIFHTRKDPMPDNCMIDSQYDDAQDDFNAAFQTSSTAVAASGSGKKGVRMSIHCLQNCRKVSMMEFMESGGQTSHGQTELQLWRKLLVIQLV